MILPSYILRRMRNILNKSCRETQNTHFMFSSFFSIITPFMSKNMVQPEGPQITSQYGAYELHINKQDYVHARACTCPRSRAQHTHQYVILAVFSRQRWIRERTSIYVIPTLTVFFFFLLSKDMHKTRR
jgi:hypothetical protein